MRRIQRRPKKLLHFFIKNKNYLQDVYEWNNNNENNVFKLQFYHTKEQSNPAYGI